MSRLPRKLLDACLGRLNLTDYFDGRVGAHPAYELRVADLVVRDLDELRLANVRKLFADVDFDPLPELEVLLETEAPPVDTLYEDLDDDYDDDGPDFFS